MCLVARLMNLARVEIPIPSDVGVAFKADFHRVPGHQLADTGIERGFAREISECKELGQRGPVKLRTHSCGQQSLDLRTKQKAFRGKSVVKRLDSQSIARDEKRSLIAIPDRESEHAAQVLHAVTAVFLVKVNNGFSIAMRPVGVTVRDQLFAQLEVIVDFAVVDDPN